jgi:ATP-binding cassette subfamily C (CFTR/MRP) protein 1
MLTTIIGPVGSGKSTLCETLLGQTQKSSGDINMRVNLAEIAYCSQTPHLANASVKENITAHSAYDHLWYLDVVRATRLLDEISNMPNRDDTIIGSKGSKLSGGQRQRLAIARAVYSRKSIVVFDDVFSGLDTSNAHNIFNNILDPNGLLRQSATTVIFVTHSSHFLAMSNHIIAMESDGTVVAKGSYDEIVSMPRYEKYATTTTAGGSSDELSSREDDKAGPPQSKESEPEDAMARARQPSDMKIYGYYAKAVGALQLLLLTFVSIAAAAFWNYSTLWLKRWADYSAHSGNSRNGYFLGIYAMFQCLTIIFLFGVALQALTDVAAQSGRQLHAVLLRTVLRAPLACLTATDTGQLINRFAQDIQLIDSELPMALMNLVLCVAAAIGQAILIMVSAPYAGMAFPPILIILYCVQKPYLRTSKQIRVLDLEAKSPL